MAAYDLRVQKPSSLAIPDSPGANDLARFLSVSESSRANREKEELSQNMFDWEKGAGARQATADEAERERVLAENMRIGKVICGTSEGYLADAAKNYRLSDDAVSRWRQANPNATPEQEENVRRSVRGDVTKNNNAFVDEKEMSRQLQSTLMSDHGLTYDQAQKAARDQTASYLSNPKDPNEEILKARLEIIKNGGISDGMSKFGISGNGGSDSAYSGSKGSDEFRKGAKFVTDNQLNNENNQWEKGSEGFWDNILPGRDQVFIDDAEAMALNAQTQNGVEAQYVIAALEGLSSDGKLPDGYSVKDMRNVKSDFYKDVVKKAGELQNYFKSGAGGGGGKGTQLSLEQFRGIRQGDLKMKMQAVNQLEAALKSFGGGPLSSEDQYQLMSDPQLLEQFGIAMNQSLQQQGGGNNSAGNSTPAAVPAPVVENSGAEAGKGSSVAAEDGDDPELKSLIEGENKDDQPIEEATEEEVLKAISNTPVSNSSGEYKSRDELVAIQELRNKVNSGNATQAEKDSLIDIYSDTDTDLEIEVTLPENVKDMTFMDLRESVPEGADRQKIYDLYRKGKAGNASKSEMKELSDALNSGSRKTK